MNSTKPNKFYTRIRLQDCTYRYDAIKTRNIWNEARTGKFLAYDQQVVDAQALFTCPNCGVSELLWLSEFDEDNEFQINCDVCNHALI